MLASLSRVDGGQRFGDGIDEGVRADEAGARIGLRLRDQMLGAAEADFQAHLVERLTKQRAQIGRRGLGEIERELRQQRVEQRGLPRLQRMALAPAEEGALRCWRFVQSRPIIPLMPAQVGNPGPRISTRQPSVWMPRFARADEHDGA